MSAPGKVNKDLVDVVLHRIDELSPTGVQPVFDAGFVGSELEFAAHGAVVNSPKEVFIEAGKARKGTVDSSDISVIGQIMDISMPEDFADVVRLRLSSWQHNALSLSGYAELEDIERCNHGNSTFSAQNPFVCLTQDDDGDQVLRCYPAGSTDTVDVFLYIPWLEPEDLPQRLQDAACWDAAGRLLQSDKDYAYLAPRAFAIRDDIMSKKGRRKSGSNRLKYRPL